MANEDVKDGRAPSGTATEETAEEGHPLTEAQRALGKAPKVAPKMKAEAALLPPDIVEQAAVSYFEKVRENWQVIAAATLVVIVVGLFANWRIESAHARNRLAQEQLRAIMTASVDGVPSREKLEELATNFAGTDAQPFALLAIGDIDAKKGLRDSLAKAVEMYERVLRDWSDNPLAKDIARRSLDRTKAALAFDPVAKATALGEKTEWAKGETASAATPAPAPTPAPSPAPAPK